MGKNIRTLTVFYDMEIAPHEIPLFRGAVLKSLGDKASVLYHNHTGADTYRFSYPLIQYRRVGGKAAITCIGEGIELVGQMLSEPPKTLMIGTREAKCHIERVQTQEVAVAVGKDFHSYHLRRWHPLNSENYARFRTTDNLVEKIQMLERVLTGNILSFLKGVGIHLEEQLELHITQILHQKVTTYKGVRLMAFDIEFKANISLPPSIGIGKNTSIGYGVLSLA